ncbi:N-acetylmuramoyl-L-alanine amidase family protein [Salinicoccus halitifaciens]|uniref:N-acetylmuramoyl-L-alanine amidase n=1 Tax=Salinicoccus halitifaciens TaxID=1073415 RepID=A0ABV2E6X1_9STAP|nr:N-acetylmuramoyl-L-alanine amidase [Salinicoccus halitifaciens]MCD2136792.1 N-acetylmuramoyl-L-alanine amidase [Salinicoccus halitifaciens]
MNSVRKGADGFVQTFIRFLKNRKPAYLIPLFFILSAVAVISIVYFMFLTVSALAGGGDDEEWTYVAMDFDQEADISFDGETIIIDPGHGGRDPGAPSVSGKTEAEIVYSIALKTAETLEAAGADVEFTRGQDEYASLDDREVQGDLFISLHSDAMNDASITGFTTYYTYEYQREFAETMNTALDGYSKFRNRGTHQSNYQVTWQLDYPAVLIELGYLSNEIDDRLLSDEAYQDLMARAIVEGIHDYLY